MARGEASCPGRFRAPGLWSEGIWAKSNGGVESTVGPRAPDMAGAILT